MLMKKCEDGSSLLASRQTSTISTTSTTSTISRSIGSSAAGAVPGVGCYEMARDW